MDLTIDPIIFNGSNYVVWELDMEILLKSNRLWHYKILDPIGDQESFLLMEIRMRL
jgi:hypothetical protein